jgi:hypothetical protein
MTPTAYTLTMISKHKILKRSSAVRLAFFRLTGKIDIEIIDPDLRKSGVQLFHQQIVARK